MYGGEIFDGNLMDKRSRNDNFFCILAKVALTVFDKIKNQFEIQTIEYDVFANKSSTNNILMNVRFWLFTFFVSRMNLMLTHL